MKRQRLFSMVLRTGGAVVLVFILLASPLAPSRSAWADGAFIVNTSLDEYNQSDGLLSLREAIRVANGTLTGPFSAGEQTQLGGCTFDGGGNITSGCGAGVFDNITFDSAVTEITPASTLPALIGDGTWINGVGGVPRINAINLSGAVFIIDANHVTISNLSIVNGSDSGGIDIQVQSGKDARIAYDYLGTLPGATTCTPTGVTRTSTTGILVNPNSSGSSGINNSVAYIYGSTIGCHSGNGIDVSGTDYVTIGLQTDGATLDGNWIGTNSSGTSLPNLDGIRLYAIGADGVRYARVYGNTIANNNEDGLSIIGTGTNDSSSSSSNQARGNTMTANHGAGVGLFYGAYQNTIGGSAAGDANTISGNGSGVVLSYANSNSIQGNSIHDNGNFILISPGISVQFSDQNSIIENNIRGNQASGVELLFSNGNTLISNTIGVNAAGDAAAPNGADGVLVTDSSRDNLVGDSNSLHRNLVSGNSQCGVRLSTDASYNTISANQIGLNNAGDAAIPNGEAGICILSNASHNDIGTELGSFQYISGNSGPGVKIVDSDMNYIHNTNTIGIALDGISPLGNSQEGVLISGGSGNTVHAYYIYYNGKAGVALVGNTATADIRPYRVGANGGLPIDLGNDGFTPNDPLDTDTGPNGLLNYPEITSYSGSPVTLHGKVCSLCMVIIYRAPGNPAVPGGEAQQWDFTTNYANTTADIGGNWSYTLPSGVSRYDVSTLAYSAGLTSELSPNPRIFMPEIMR